MGYIKRSVRRVDIRVDFKNDVIKRRDGSQCQSYVYSELEIQERYV